MEELLKKLYYRGQKRIVVINAPADFYRQLSKALPEVQSDIIIDPRYLYDFMLIFALSQDDVLKICPQAIHNLSPDGKLWIAFPRNTSKDNPTDLDRNHGWSPFEQSGYKKVSQVSIDDEWSALRFRNKKFIKSANKEE